MSVLNTTLQLRLGFFEKDLEWNLPLENPANHFT